MKRFTVILLLIGMFFLFSSSKRCSAELSEGFGAQNNELRTEIHDIFKDPRFRQTDYLKIIKQFIQRISSYFKFKSTGKPKFAFDFEAVLKRLFFGITLLLPFLLVYWFNHFGSRNIILNHPTGERVKPEIPHILLEKARNLADRGEYREAVRYLYLETLSHLKNKKLILEGTQYSDYEHLRALRQKLGRSHPLCLTFQILLQLFQEKWYGMRTCTQEDYLKTHDLLSSIIQKTGGYHEIK